MSTHLPHPQRFLALLLGLVLVVVPTRGQEEDRDDEPSDDEMRETEPGGILDGYDVEPEVLDALGLTGTPLEDLTEEQQIAVREWQRSRNITRFTATLASAEANWPAVWAEGDEDHRAALSAIQGQPAPAWHVDRWLRGTGASLEGLQGHVVVLAVVPHWRERVMEDLRDLDVAVFTRSGMRVAVVVIHPGEAPPNAGAHTTRYQGVHFGIDETRETVLAYHVDGYPDYHVIGRDGVLLCADVANDHVLEVLDAVLQGWRPE